MLIVGTNSHVSLDDADSYFSSSLNSNIWLMYQESEECREWRCSLLIAATAAVDRLKFAGSITRRDQPLGWPRIRVRDHEGRSIPSDTVPQAVKDATCELALLLMQKEPLASLSSAVSHKRVGDLEIQYRATVHDPVLPIVRELLAPFLAGSPNSVELIP